MSLPHVLILGGHGKVALRLTPILLQKSWSVTSVIRNPEHEADIKATAGTHPGKLNVLVSSIEDVKSTAAAAEVIGSVKPDYVVWSAGAAGKGGPARTYAIDRDAAKFYIAAAAESSTVTKFLLVSYVHARRDRAPWWTEADWEYAQSMNSKILPDYYKAKVDADEYLVAKAKAARDAGKKFLDIDLRPGTLGEDVEGEKVSLGRTTVKGKVSRLSVAKVAAGLLEKDYRGWIDLLDGSEGIDAAVSRVVNEQVDDIEGEDLERIYARAKELD
ncbi:hypothetical protein ABW19_dt0206636 [Dactylella cylindrospora]|nr:hypothetical protein ABW19_dt0206636 [Dactylella cylindrospora]